VCYLCVGAGLVFLAGCLCIRSDVKYSPSDPSIAKSNAAQIKVGKSTREQLLSLLGTPSHQSTDENGVEILSYMYHKTTDGSFSFLIVDIDDKKQEEMELCFEVKDGIVINSWRKP